MEMIHLDYSDGDGGLFSCSLINRLALTVGTPHISKGICHGYKSINDNKPSEQCAKCHRYHHNNTDSSNTNNDNQLDMNTIVEINTKLEDDK